MRRWNLVSMFIIAGVTAMVYLNALDNGFHYDDEHYIQNNQFLERWENVPAMFTTTRFYSDDQLFTGHYRPLVYVTYAVNKISGGNNPVGYHVVNLIFHIGSAMLLYLIIKAMLGSGVEDRSKKLEVRRGADEGLDEKLEDRSKILGEGFSNFLPLTSGFYVAFAAALIFAVHPFNSEVVNYITARSSVMSGFFYLLAFYCWVRYRGSLTSYFYLSSLLAFLLGMLSKEVVITLPVILWLYDLYFFYPYRTSHSVLRTLFNWRTYTPYLPFILSVLVPYFVIRKIKYGVFAIPVLNRDIYINLLTETRVLVKYIIMLIVPAGQSVYHDIDVSTSIMDLRVLLSLALLAIIGFLTFILARSDRHEWRIVSFSFLWFFVTLLPTTLFPLNDILQENRGYLAGVSFAVIVALILGWFLHRTESGTLPSSFSSIVFLCLVLLLIVYSVTSFKRNKVWQDEYTLWSDVLVKYPDAYKPYHALGLFYMDRGENDRALEYFKRALRIYPAMYQAYNRIGIIYGEKGDTMTAISMFKKTIELRPDFHRAYYNLGTTYYLNNDIEPAIANYMKALELSPYYTEPYMALAEIYLRRKDPDRAKEMYEKVTYIKPSEARAYYRLGVIYEAEGKKAISEGYYKTALKIDPGLRGAEERLRGSGE